MTCQAHYYNENNKKAAAWLRALISGGLIPKGEVDERSIVDVRPSDLSGFVQCHFFAGIGGWPYALRLADWPEDKPVWTGSCPCQPWSIAGDGLGESDPRHLWPILFHLIRERQPSVFFGEQVESADSLRWLDGVANDLEGCGYAIGKAVLPACGVGANHRRYRIFFVAHSERSGLERPFNHDSVSGSAQTPFTESRNALANSRRFLARDFSCLLPSDGVSVQMERDALKAFGNAIVPELAAQFIQASVEAINEL